jgi:hypothetical protein
MTSHKARRPNTKSNTRKTPCDKKRKEKTNNMVDAIKP